MKLIHHALSLRGKALLALFAGLAALALALAVHTAPASALRTDPTCTQSGCTDSSDDPGSGSAHDGSASTDPGGNSSFEGSEYGTSIPTGGDSSFEGSEYGPDAPVADDYQGHKTTDERADHPADPTQSDPFAKYRFTKADDYFIGHKPGESDAEYEVRMLRTAKCWPILAKETRLHQEIKRGKTARHFGSIRSKQNEVETLVEEYFDAGCGTAMQGAQR